MSTKLFKSALEKRRLSLGSWVQIGHPAVAEVLAGCGMDWICVDLEHGAIDLSEMTNLFRAIDSFKSCTPIARLPLNDPIWIRRTLDAGAQGLIIPMINHPSEAEAAIKQAKYPPCGIRGFGYSRSNKHGMHFSKSTNTFNDELVMIMQIEHKNAIDHLDEILEVPGVDGLFIGPLDLSGSMGLVGQLDHPQMVDALTRYRKACLRHKKAAGIHIVRPTPSIIKQSIDEGYSFIAMGLDNVFIEEGAKASLHAAGR